MDVASRNDGGIRGSASASSSENSKFDQLDIIDVKLSYLNESYESL